MSTSPEIDDLSRVPHGARGLKRWNVLAPKQYAGSRPARGAWIETIFISQSPYEHQRRVPHGARGLKQAQAGTSAFVILSRPARGAWIETRYSSSRYSSSRVASRTGRVD